MRVKFLIIILFLIFAINSQAFALNTSAVSRAINGADLSHDSIIAVSVKDNKTGANVYSKHQNFFLNPASTLKVFTMAAALDTLGKNYNFETIIYLDKQHNIYLKTGADPLFSSDDLNTLILSLKKAYNGRIKNFYIDDSVIDKKYYPDGWTVDDFWPNSPEISPCIIDGNTVKVTFLTTKDKKGKPFIQIVQNNDYKFSFINELTVSEVTEIIPSLNYGTDSGIVTLRGTLSGEYTKDFPVLNTEQFFAIKLRKALDKNAIYYSKPFYNKPVPADAKRIASFKRPLDEVLTFVLKTSNNFAAETVFKLAASVWAKDKEEYIKQAYLKDVDFNTVNSSGNFENGKKMFEEYYKNLGFDVSKIKLADASGVSRYNALSAQWTTDALFQLNKKSEIKKYMMTSNEGTLSRRLRELEGNLKAKTGTIFGISSLCGYILSLGGNDYSFSVIIQNLSDRPSLIKGLEDDIVRSIYSLR